VRALDPHSEADPVALQVQTLVAFGNALGRTAHWRAEGDTHHLNLFAVLVGSTSKGRKGSSWGVIRNLPAQVEADWLAERVQGGLSSGEGLIWSCRDKIEKRESVKDKGRIVDYQMVEVDPGVADKRLLCYEPEYASVLKMLERQGNTLSTVVRQAWESGNLRTMTKNSPAKATGAHISILGHVTAEEIRRYLSATEQANGFGNRFLWFLVRRSKVLLEGGACGPTTWSRSGSASSRRWRSPRAWPRWASTRRPGRRGTPSTARCPRASRAWPAACWPGPRRRSGGWPASTHCWT
jgi:hypothetical protein